MTLGDPSAVSDPRNRAERRSADRQRRRRKGLAVATGASVIVSGANLVTASPAGAAPFSVTTGADSGEGSLRQAVIDANSADGLDTITISAAVSTIELSSGSIDVTDPLAIVGHGMTALTITADESTSNDGSRLFYLSGADSVSISRLTITGATSGGSGAAIRAVATSLSLDEVTLSGNTSTGGSGGALYIAPSRYGSATLDIADSVLSGNSAASGGGAAAVNGDTTVSVSGSLITGNTAASDGGAILVDGSGDVSISDDTTFSLNTSGSEGGALALYMNADLAQVTISDSAFSLNDASGDGGAVTMGNDNNSSSVSIVRTTITGNESGDDGGGLYLDLEYADVAITGSTISDNISDGSGGGVAARLYRSDLTITDSTISGNVTDEDGGGLYLEADDGGTVLITGTTISDNDAAGDGGGLIADLYEVSLAVVASTITGNEADYDLSGGGAGGGASIDLYDGVVSISRTTVSNNTARGQGGGILLDGEYNASLEIGNSTISGNTAAVATASESELSAADNSYAYSGGGGLAVIGAGNATISESTVTGNVAAGDGDGVLATSMTRMWKYATGEGSEVSLFNTIVSDNGSSATSEDVATVDLQFDGTTEPVDPASISASFSLIRDGGNSGIVATPENGNLLNVSAQLAGLASNGGPTQTHLPLSSSPVRDAGDPAFDGGSHDQRGLTRELNGRIDIGSVESLVPATFVPEPTTTTTPPTIAPPTTTPAPVEEQPAPSAPSPGGSTTPVFVTEDGDVVQVPLPTGTPSGEVRASVAVSATESIAVTADGQIYSTNPAYYFGGVPATTRLQAPMIGMGIHWTRRSTAAVQGFEAAASEDWVPSGYWLLGADGGVFSFGTAKFLGSTGAMRLNKPVIAMTPTPTGNGYWLVASDGGVFSFGDAKFFGSTGAIKLVKPVVSLLPTATGLGYWLIASDGGVFSYGDATFFGSGANTKKTFTGAMRSEGGAGYWLLEANGTRTPFGDAR